MADYKAFENALDITEQMYDTIPLLAGKVILQSILDSSEEYKAKEKAKKEAREKMSLEEGALYDMRKFYGRMKR